jgi:hypothetical protein
MVTAGIRLGNTNKGGKRCPVTRLSNSVEGLITESFITESFITESLLRVFADQVEEIREEIYTEKYAKYEAKMKEYEEGPMVKYEETMTKWREWRDEQDAIQDAKNHARKQRELLAEAFVAEFAALDDLGSMRYLDSYIGLSLSERFETVEDVRNATDEQLLWINRVGPKTLKDIRMRIHPHTWESFETDSGRTGQYCDGCKARTGFVAC